MNVIMKKEIEVNYIKVVILVVAIIIAIVVGLHFFKKLKDPPTTEYVSPFPNAVQTNIDNLEINKDISLEQLYSQILDQMSFYKHEKLIKPEQSDTLLIHFVNTYSNIFLNNCYTKFNASKWYVDDQMAMRNRINDLNAFRLSNGRFVVDRQGSLEARYSSVIVTINHYNAAVQLARQTSYTSLNNAKNKIRGARAFKREAYLSNCSALVSSLSALPQNLNNSHYRYLQNRVEVLGQYRQYDEDSYINLITSVENEIRSYKANAKGTYGTVKDVSSLFEQSDAYQMEARDYYER